MDNRQESELVDTSTEYIKMCDCKEVQDVRPFIADMDNDRYLGCTPTGDFYYGFREKIVWLPRQDQLQGMIEANSYILYSDPQAEGYPYTIETFSFRDRKDKRFPDTSTEKAMLRAIMYKSCNKTWDGKWL